MPRGRIIGFSGSWSSGIAMLTVETEEGIDHVWCDNPPTVRALDRAFGNVIGEGHTVNQAAIEGREIEYETDALGVLEGFTPVGVTA